MLKELEFAWKKHPDKKYSDRQYLEFIVSGQPLHEYLGVKEQSRVTPFGFFPDKKEQKRALREFRFQQRSLLIDNRVELYICEDCGDIRCGAITTKIIDEGDKIIWAQFATQNDPEEISELLAVEQIEFNRQDYFKAFSKIN